MTTDRAKGASRATVPTDVRIYDAVCEAILQRRLAPGTKLQETALGKHFHVSRTIVRRALQRLSYQGIVSLRPKRVAVVARPTLAEVEDVFAARRGVETAVVALVSKRISRRDVTALTQLVSLEEAAYDRGDRSEGLRLSLGFHDRLAALSGNPILARYLRELVLQTSLVVALYERPGVAHAHAAHVDLVAAIGCRDERRAVRLMAQHLTELQRALQCEEETPAQTLGTIFGAGAISVLRKAGVRRKRPAA
jgi:DNA-binding GntR family transcriptional regulator